MADAPGFAPPPLDFVFEARVRVGAPLELGQTPGGRRRVIPILGGEVAGPRMRGVVLPGGADWQVIDADNRAELTARYTLQAEDGTLVSVTNRALRHGPPEVIRRLIAGEAVDQRQIYFRGAPSFAVAAGPHDWLLRHVFICTGERHPEEVVIRFFAVL